MVDRQNLVPAASAARAASISPSPWTRPAKSGRRDRERHRYGLAQHRSGERYLGNVDQYPLAQADGVEIVAIGVERDLVVRASLHIVKDCARNFAPGDPPQIFDIGDDGHGGTQDVPLGRTADHRPLSLELAGLTESPQIRGHHGRHGEGLDAERFERAAFTLGRLRDNGIAAQQLDLVGR